MASDLKIAGTLEKKSVSIAGLCEFFFEAEAQLGLLDWSVRGVHIWPSIRIKAYYKLAKALGIYSESSHFEHSLRDRLILMGKLVAGFFSRNPFLSGKKPYVLVAHFRKVKGVDIYSDRLLREAGEKTLLLDTILYGQTYPDAYSMDPFLALGGIYNRIIERLSPVMSKPDHLMIEAFEAMVREHFGVGITIDDLVINDVRKFLFLKPFYKALFKWKGVQRLYIVVGYMFPYITAAAQELNIPITEFQHGTITPYHLGYSYPGRPAVPYQADELLCFGKYWFETTELPGQMVPSVIGAPHVYEIINRTKIAKIPRTILFSSQTVLGPEIFAFALETAKLLPEYTVTLNLHPHDNPSKYDITGAPANFTMLFKAQDIFELIGSSEYQAGVFSTTLFEGMALGTKVILLDMPGIEYMGPLRQRGDAVFVHTPQEFVQHFQSAKTTENYRDYYAPPAERLV